MLEPGRAWPTCKQLSEPVLHNLASGEVIAAQAAVTHPPQRANHARMVSSIRGFGRGPSFADLCMTSCKSMLSREETQTICDGL